MADGTDIVERLRDRDAIVLSGLFHAVPVMNEAADLIERLRAQAPGWRMAMEAAAMVAERAISAGERVRDAMAPESPVDGLERALHGIVVTTAKGIAANIRALPEPPAEGGMCSPASGLGSSASKRSAQ